jgi:hypothetical protein
MILSAFLSIADKYKIELALDVDTLAAAVFGKPYFAVGNTIPRAKFETDYRGQRIRNRYYFSDYDMRKTLDLVEDVQPTSYNKSRVCTSHMTELYVALTLSIFIVCYRRFSRRVFLISIIGSLVWMIIIFLIMISSRGSQGTFATTCLLLTAAFLAISLVQLQRRTAKTLTGVTLTWFGFLLPYTALFVMSLLNNLYESRSMIYQRFTNSDALMKEKFPVLYWVKEHPLEIGWANILLSVLFFAFVYNLWAKRWHLMAEE